jgi:hypothetical protein
MSCVRLLAVAIVLAVLHVPTREGAPQSKPSEPQFQSSVTAVGVHVVVKRGGRPVSGLTVGDFLLRDSDIPQEIRAVDARLAPLDVTIVVEQTQGSEFLRRGYRAEIASVAERLAPRDSLRVISAGNDIAEIQDDSAPVLSLQSSFNDSLTSVLIPQPHAGRFRVVIGMSSGDDTMSIVTDDALLDLAKRSDAQMYTLVTEPTLRGTRSAALWLVGVRSAASWDEPNRSRLRAISNLNGLDRQWQALSDERRRTLVRIAEATGGGEIGRSWFSDSIAGPVQRVLDEVRSGYVVYYVPTGVPERGWHPIEVQLTRPGNYEIHARPGYLR